MIKLTSVVKNYPNFHLECSLSVPENRVTALIGPNGAGKSTAFKAILGLVFPEGGRIELFGKTRDQITEKDQGQIGVVLSDSGFCGYLQIRDILPVMARLYPEFEKDAFVKSCAQSRLPLDKKIKDFSTGMKAKLKVLAAISHNPRLLILDEPTAGLDVLARGEVLDMLRDYMIPGGRSILISSHISGDLEGFCDDFYMIDQGKIVMHEDTDVLIDDYGIIKVTEEKYETMDKKWLLRKKREAYGFSLLTAQKRFYRENEPGLAIEKCSIDEALLMMIKGEAI